ncbi:hypothetical protein D3C80_521140 [compost metagenome]
MQQDTEPEGRDRHAGNREDTRHLVERPVLVDGRQHAERNTDDDAEEHRDEDEFQRRRRITHHFFEHRPCGDDRGAEITADEFAHVDDELFRQRLVETIFRADRRDHILGRIGTGHETGRIAGRDIGDQECQRGYADHRADQRQQLAEGEFQHRLLRLL